MIKLNIREKMAGRWFFMLLSTLTTIGPMLLYLVGGILIMKYRSDLTVGDITVLVALLGRMYGPVNSLLNIQVDWIRSMAMFTRIFEYYAFRYKYPEEVKYSWWSYRFQARQKNAGWRIDYFVISDRLRERLEDAAIHTDIFGSDHCPVALTLR